MVTMRVIQEKYYVYRGVLSQRNVSFLTKEEKKEKEKKREKRKEKQADKLALTRNVRDHRRYSVERAHPLLVSSRNLNGYP